MLRGYIAAMEGCPSYPQRPGDARSLLDLFILENTFVEIAYELENRPSWVRIPLEGLQRILATESLAAHAR
jgi:maltose alpha-D-glucosyltransferase/alpha-amylase